MDGSISSNTRVHEDGTLAGSGTIGSSVTNNGTVRPGDGGPGTLTITGDYAQTSSGLLLIDIAGASAGQFTLLDVLGSATLGGFLDPVLQNGFVPTVGESFTFLEYASYSGSLSIHDPNIDGTFGHWVITYQPGEAILTVAAGSISALDSQNASLPDSDSTLLLLVCGFLAVAISRRRLSKAS